MTEAQPSAQGRRVLVARVTGEVGRRIQAWREQYDPEQAQRLPPHTTLCYWPPAVDPDLLYAQIRHAFDEPVTVRLGSVHEFDNTDHTFYLEVQETAALDRMRERLFDGTHVKLAGRTTWTWHVTCVRYGNERDLRLLHEVADQLTLNMPWQVDTVSYLELRGDRYETIAEWTVTPAAST